MAYDELGEKLKAFSYFLKFLRLGGKSYKKKKSILEFSKKNDSLFFDL